MSAVPSAVAGTLRLLADALRQILRSKLVGAYVYGSLTQSAFDPARSDIDCLVVVRRDLTQAQVRKLRMWLRQVARNDAWIPRLQMQILRRGRLLHPDTHGYLYQFGTLKRSGSDGNPIVWLNVLATGITLAGPSPEVILPAVTSEMVHEALRREVAYLRAEITSRTSKWRGQTSYRAYAILTLCRILYTHRKGGVVSKRRAASWAVRVLPVPLHALIREAIASDNGQVASLPMSHISRFLSFTETQLASTR